MQAFTIKGLGKSTTAAVRNSRVASVALQETGISAIHS